MASLLVGKRNSNNANMLEGQWRGEQDECLLEVEGSTEGVLLGFAQAMENSALTVLS